MALSQKTPRVNTKHSLPVGRGVTGCEIFLSKRCWCRASARQKRQRQKYKNSRRKIKKKLAICPGFSILDAPFFLLLTKRSSAQHERAIGTTQSRLIGTRHNTEQAIGTTQSRPCWRRRMASTRSHVGCVVFTAGCLQRLLVCCQQLRHI